MKFNHKCPKCESSEVVKEDKKSNPYYFTNYVYVKKNWASYIPLTRYICLHCGFTEEWIDEQEDLEKIDKKYKKDTDYDGFV